MLDWAMPSATLVATIFLNWLTVFFQIRTVILLSNRYARVLVHMTHKWRFDWYDILVVLCFISVIALSSYGLVNSTWLLITVLVILIAFNIRFFYPPDKSVIIVMEKSNITINQIRIGFILSSVFILLWPIYGQIMFIMIFGAFSIYGIAKSILSRT
jgi:hypothetical protein